MNFKSPETLFTSPGIDLLQATPHTLPIFTPLEEAQVKQITEVSYLMSLEEINFTQVSYNPKYINY